MYKIIPPLTKEQNEAVIQRLLGVRIAAGPQSDQEFKATLLAAIKSVRESG